MPPGGERTGQPQTAYPRRRDLNAGTQPVRSARSVVYGDRQRRENAQAVIPLPATRGVPTALTPLTAPTERPGEPVTAGLPIGAGSGPSVSYAPVNANNALWELRALVARHPEYTDLARIVAQAEAEI